MKGGDPIVRLDHLLAAVAEIRLFTAGKDHAAYEADPMLRRAVERCIEIISEASRHIPAELKAAHPGIPWRAVAGIGNVLRHEYGRSTIGTCGRSSSTISGRWGMP
ncbi:MAG TPA: HepT-like ribonuclease domain-containing protein [Geminicoccaceae bacterium]|nr:HepT-like ribonuclease domain-containing protein [Geminicoccaceae bacterium]